MARIDQVREKLAASLDENGKPLKGYGLRVTALRRELSRLELQGTARDLASMESAGVDTPAASA